MRKPNTSALHSLDVRTLRLFVAIVHSGSLTRAALDNHLAVGAASRRISNFESLIGAPLLERHSRGLRLTPTGHLVAEYAQKILEQVNALGNVSVGLRQGIKERVRLLSNSAAITQHLPSTLNRFRKTHPAILVEVEETLSWHTAHALQRKHANIGIMVSSSPTMGLSNFPYRNERLLLVVPEGHPLEKRQHIRFEETLDYEYIGLTPNSSIYTLLREQAKSAGKTIRIHAQVNGLDNACRMVAAGLGMTIAPEGLANSCRTALNLKLIELDGTQYRFDQIVLHNDEAHMTAPERALLKHLREDHEPSRPPRRGR